MCLHLFMAVTCYVLFVADKKFPLKAHTHRTHSLNWSRLKWLICSFRTKITKVNGSLVYLIEKCIKPPLFFNGYNFFGIVLFLLLKTLFRVSFLRSLAISFCVGSFLVEYFCFCFVFNFCWRRLNLLFRYLLVFNRILHPIVIHSDIQF